MSQKLTEKQKIFCVEYLKDLNATRAAIAAGYSEKAAAVIGCENLIKPNIAEYIQAKNQERLKKVEVDAEYVLREAKRCFEFNAQANFDEDGNAEMVNATAAKGFLELLGKHKDIKAFDEGEKKDSKPTPVTLSFRMPTGEEVAAVKDAD